MDPRDTADDAPESLNREQQEADQAQDIANDAMRPGTGHDSVRGPSDRTQTLPDDTPDLVETMNAMVRSGHIDNGAFAGEPQHDDEEDIRGDTETDGDDPLEDLHPTPAPGDSVFNEYADGSEDPLAVPVDLPPEETVALEDLADTGEDPLATVASEHGLEDEDADDDDDDYDVAEDDDLNDDDEEADDSAR